MNRAIAFIVSLCAAFVAGVSLADGSGNVTRLPYICSTGTQYIDTQIKLQSPSDVVYMRFRPTTVGNGGVLFGNRKTADSKCFIAHYNNNIANDTAVTIDDGTYRNNRWCSLDYKSLVTMGEGKVLDIMASSTNITVKIDGVVCGPKVPATSYTFETPGTCTILKGVKVSGGSLPNENGVIGELYAFSIVRDGTPIIDLVPAQVGEKIGMYDLVSGELFENAGTDDFVAGKGSVQVFGEPPLEGALSPAAGSRKVFGPGESLDFKAITGTNLFDQVRSVIRFYTIEEQKVGETVYSAPVTNFGTVYTHVQRGDVIDTRLTWHWAREALLRLGSSNGGKVMVNGQLAADGADGALPTGYEKLDYVESHGNSWIDTGIELNSPSNRVILKYTFDPEGRGSGGVLFGSRVTAKSRCFISHYNNYTDDFGITIDNSEYAYNRWISGAGFTSYQGRTVDIDASIDAIRLVCPMVSYDNTVIPRNKDEFTTPGTCRLFKGELAAEEGASLPNTNCAYGRMHRFLIANNGKVVMSLVPVKNPQGIAGFFDYISRGFFPSEGTEPFLPGPAVVEMWVDLAEPVRLLAKPTDRFRGWAGDVTKEDEMVNPLDLSVTGGKTIFANFAPRRPGFVLLLK